MPRTPSLLFTSTLLFLVLLPAAAALIPIVETPDDAGILNPGVNLFQMIDWREAQALTPCGVGEFDYGPGNRILYSENTAGTFLPPPVRGCAEVAVSYRAPFPSDHLHLRFLFSANTTATTGAPSIENLLATVHLRGPGGTTAPASIRPGDIAYPEFWPPASPDGVGGWVQDPGPALPHHFRPGVPQHGQIVWQFETLPTLDEPAPLPAPTPVHHRALNVALVSVEPDPGLWFRDNPDTAWAPAHLEYSFVELPGMRVERHDVDREDGRRHQETHFIVHLDEDTLSGFGASIQLELETGMAFSRVILPDGSTVAEMGQVDRLDWRAMAAEYVQMQILTDPHRFAQITVPYSLVEKAGPGTYVVIVERPSAATPTIDETLRTTLIALAFTPALVGAYASRNVRRYIRGMELQPPRARHGMNAALISVSIGYLGYILYSTFGIGWTNMAQTQAPHLAWITMFVLVLIIALYSTIAVRSSEHVMQNMRRDLDERQRLAANLERSNRDLALFASTAAHDLGAPLRSVRAFAEMLEKDYSDKLDADGQELLRYTADGARRMQTLVSELLEFSRAQTGEGKLAPIALDECLKEATANLKSTIRKTKATIEWDQGLPQVPGWHASLVRLFQNLFENAMKFQPEGQRPHIRVQTITEEEGMVHITVQDNGIGIPADELEHVMQPLYRASARKRFEGHGLGLALVQRIVDAHQGRIWLTSTFGEGTTVHIVLPVVR